MGAEFMFYEDHNESINLFAQNKLKTLDRTRP